MKASESASVITGPATEEMRRAFGAALDAVIRSKPAKIADVAAHVGVSDDAVRKWTSGSNSPNPLTLFAVERFLGVTPGELSRHLGFVPAEAPVSTLQAIETDPRIVNDTARSMVVAAYKQAVRHA